MQEKFLVCRDLDRLKIPSLGSIYELYRKSEYFMNPIFAMNSSKSPVVEYILCMVEDVQSVTMPNIGTIANVLR